MSRQLFVTSYAIFITSRTIISLFASIKNTNHFPCQLYRIKACSVLLGRSRSLTDCANISRKCREEKTIEKFFLSDFCVSVKIVGLSKTETTVSLVSATFGRLSNLFETDFPECFRDLAYGSHANIWVNEKEEASIAENKRREIFEENVAIIMSLLKRDGPKATRTGKARDASIFVQMIRIARSLPR